MRRLRSQLNGREHGGFPPSSKPGTLYVVSTPIGHPDDLSLRGLTILRTASLVAAEHPAVTQELLAHHHIHAIITSYGPGNLPEKISLLIDRLRRGQDVALVVDSGTPAVHDPGQLLITAAHRNRVPVRIIPGPSAVTASMALSGYSGDRFVFAGKLPGSTRSLRQFLQPFCHEAHPVIFLADRRQLSAALRQIADLFGRRELTLAVDLTKRGEGVLRGPACALIAQLESIPHPAEVTLILKEQTRAPHNRGQTANKGAIRRRRGGG